eukprot:CAMPEP_0174756474 /NCGR_PEP_ID=MMETSP1094-20130205/106774_1 /TAXON_ID=156173 /ORGANISM="Chrysochromulina brevifilum, Strain UTEX LB 985" /LENGTH=93 /DNA_ID=CAMNT_0015962381 /DNA_START=330 /DNA_END=612 /DNA_ORIENTATION=+
MSGSQKMTWNGARHKCVWSVTKPLRQTHLMLITVMHNDPLDLEATVRPGGAAERGNGPTLSQRDLRQPCLVTMPRPRQRLKAGPQLQGAPKGA